MKIVFQSHRATVSDRTRQRALRGVEKLARRLTRPVSAVVRFEEDGPQRRVEIVVNASRGRRLVAEGQGRFFGPALAAALAHMDAQARHVRRAKTSARRVTRSR